MKIEQIDVFTTVVGKGNPTAVVTGGETLTDTEMQSIAKQIGFNETVFVCSSNKASVRLRYFTPGYETGLCGHATIGAIYSLFKGSGISDITIETKAGVLPIYYDDDKRMVTMRQATPEFKPFQESKELLCRSIGIDTTDLHSELPIMYGSTGSWTLVVPVVNPATLDKMKADQSQFPDILLEIPNASIHPFAIDKMNKTVLYGRHFSSPFSGTIEDSVTGTASGVMGAYMMDHVFVKDSDLNLTVHQGKQMNREGTVFVHVCRERHQTVDISGTACFNSSLNL